MVALMIIWNVRPNIFNGWSAHSLSLLLFFSLFVLCFACSSLFLFACSSLVSSCFLLSRSSRSVAQDVGAPSDFWQLLCGDWRVGLCECGNDCQPSDCCVFAVEPHHSVL